jgi:hypothetical protein
VLKTTGQMDSLKPDAGRFFSLLLLLSITADLFIY